MGQESLRQEEAPIRGGVGRCRIRTVIQNIIYIAARVSRHARQTTFNFGRYGPWLQTVGASNLPGIRLAHALNDKFIHPSPLL